MLYRLPGSLRWLNKFNMMQPTLVGRCNPSPRSYWHILTTPKKITPKHRDTPWKYFNWEQRCLWSIGTLGICVNRLPAWGMMMNQWMEWATLFPDRPILVTSSHFTYLWQQWKNHEPLFRKTFWYEGGKTIVEASVACHNPIITHNWELWKILRYTIICIVGSIIILS